jgi:hypothetical protein
MHEQLQAALQGSARCSSLLVEHAAQTVAAAGLRELHIVHLPHRWVQSHPNVNSHNHENDCRLMYGRLHLFAVLGLTMFCFVVAQTTQDDDWTVM